MLCPAFKRDKTKKKGRKRERRRRGRRGRRGGKRGGAAGKVMERKLKLESAMKREKI